MQFSLENKNTIYFVFNTNSLKMVVLVAVSKIALFFTTRSMTTFDHIISHSWVVEGGTMNRIFQLSTNTRVLAFRLVAVMGVELYTISAREER